MATATARPQSRSWGLLLIRNTLLWLLPVVALWMAVTPLYNRFLLKAAENVANLTESPNVTELLRKDAHFAFVSRLDFPPSKSVVHSFRVTDAHFHLVLLGALFLAVPGVSWKKKLENLAWALLITAFFDILLVFSYVKFAYATQLGSWSLANYGPFARNFWGMFRHLMDLPFKLALPFVLWAGFYVGTLLREIRLRVE